MMASETTGVGTWIEVRLIRGPLVKVSPLAHSIPNKEAQVRRLHLQACLASVKAPPAEMADASDSEKYLRAAQMAMEEDMAEVIVLGCAGMAGLDRRLREALGPKPTSTDPAE